jgi:glycosyltransferase involved in cell wall biosynthesis
MKAYKDMRVLWIADFSVKDNKGGAQQTNREMIKYGRSKGIYIKTIYKDEPIPEKLDYDVIILNNVTKFSAEDLERLLDTGKCIRYEHDYWVADNMPEMYKKCKHVIFLSPLHKKTAEDKCGYKIKNSSLVPSPIDGNVFKMGGKKEKGSVCCIGNLVKDKGSDSLLQFIDENCNMRFYIAGWGSEVEEFKKRENVEFLGELNRKDLIKVYQKCEYFYHRPLWSEPFGRTVVEAFLCGCHLLLNDSIGAVSWGWDYSNYEEIKKNVQSQNNFWKIIKNEI